MKMRWTALVAVVVVMVVGSVLAACGPLSELGPLGDAGDAFLKALKNGDAAAAFGMLSSDLQNEVGGRENWIAAWSQGERPDSWSFSSRRIENNIGYLEGTMTWDNGQQTRCNLALEKLADTWRIIGYDFTSE